MIYGEISDTAQFRFLSAAQPFPLVFSNRHQRFMEVSQDLRVSFPPLGVMPSLDTIDRAQTSSRLGFKEHYQMNEWLLMGAGDILLLYTDGLAEHADGDRRYVPDQLEADLRQVHDRSAREIVDALSGGLRAFADPSDDVSLVVIKRC
jgi:serine phosphatase RsbU (regulator of sigma subunit)